MDTITYHLAPLSLLTFFSTTSALPSRDRKDGVLGFRETELMKCVFKI